MVCSDVVLAFANNFTKIAVFCPFSFIFSLFALYFVNKISQKAQIAAMPVADVHTAKKKRK